MSISTGGASHIWLDCTSIRFMQVQSHMGDIKSPRAYMTLSSHCSLPNQNHMEKTASPEPPPSLPDSFLHIPVSALPVLPVLKQPATSRHACFDMQGVWMCTQSAAAPTAKDARHVLGHTQCRTQPAGRSAVHSHHEVRVLRVGR